MQTIGLLGGMSWESTVPYYRIINEAVRRALGGLHSARIILNSVDFHDVARLQNAGNWTQAGEHLADAARAVEGGGADFLVLCTNTMHKVAPAIARAAQGIVLGCTEIAMLVAQTMLPCRCTTDADPRAGRRDACAVRPVLPIRVRRRFAAVIQGA